MKKLLYVIIGAASAVIWQSIRGARMEGAPPRPLPNDLDGQVLTPSDELRAPAPEV